MPARIAATSENEPIKDTIGSGPFKFVKDEWQPGNRVVYVKNADYVPRNEKPSGAAGGKRPLVDRVELRWDGLGQCPEGEALAARQRPRGARSGHEHLMARPLESVGEGQHRRQVPGAARCRK